MSTTATTYAARQHARAMAGTRVQAMPTMPATDATDLPEGIVADRVIWDEVVAPGGYASSVVARGTVIRLDDLEGEACAAVLLHNADQASERLNVADTVKIQWQAYLGQGSLLLSDMGRVMASLMSDTSGRHDALCGISNSALNDQRYGNGAVNGPYANGRDQLLVALAKHGLSKRDVAPNVSFFKGVTVAEGGTVVFVPGVGGRAQVELRTEMNLIVTVVNTPHPLDNRPGYVCTPLRITAWTDVPTRPSDAAWTATPERHRAFLNTQHYFTGRQPRGPFT